MGCRGLELMKRALVLLQLTVMMLTLSVAGGVAPKGQTRFRGGLASHLVSRSKALSLPLSPVFTAVSVCAACVASPEPPDASTISHSPPGNEGITAQVGRTLLSQRDYCSALLFQGVPKLPQSGPVPHSGHYSWPRPGLHWWSIARLQ